MHAYRTHTCAELRNDHVGEIVRVSGWVHKKRDHGDLVFIDLRERTALSALTGGCTSSRERHDVVRDNSEFNSQFGIRMAEVAWPQSALTPRPSSRGRPAPCAQGEGDSLPVRQALPGLSRFRSVLECIGHVGDPMSRWRIAPRLPPPDRYGIFHQSGE